MSVLAVQTARGAHRLAVPEGDPGPVRHREGPSSWALCGARAVFPIEAAADERSESVTRRSGAVVRAALWDPKHPRACALCVRGGQRVRTSPLRR